LWVWPESQQTDLENKLGEKLLTELFSKLVPVPSPQGSGGYTWTVPEQPAPPPTPEGEPAMPMQWIRCQIVGAIGTDEEVVHVVNLRHSTIENNPITNADLKTLSNTVRDKFALWFTGKQASFPVQLKYLEVRTSVLVQDAPATKPAWPQPTQVSPFAATVAGTNSSAPLPYEVALGLSLNTNFRGTSRFRGRTYLGPLPVGLMGSDGQFVATMVESMGATFGTDFLGGIESATDYEAHVISQKFNTSAKITGIRVGKTPDSQRRRRRDRPELYTQVWGTPVGAL
jgi:hypothetical protein